MEAPLIGPTGASYAAMLASALSAAILGPLERSTLAFQPR
jgi:hypothetical protein